MRGADRRYLLQNCLSFFPKDGPRHLRVFQDKLYAKHTIASHDLLKYIP